MAANEGLITVNDLITKFRASGAYTIYRDNTKQPQVVANEPVRMVAGFSRSGLYNRPVFIRKGDTAFFDRMFGEGDELLERKGSWFHHSGHVSLEEGSILALNLLKTNDTVDANGVPTVDADAVDYRSFSTSIAQTNGVNTSRLLASYYNKERFWFLDSEYLLATRKTTDAGSIFNLVSVSQNKYSFIVKKSDLRGYDVTALEWYGDKSKIPAYIKPTDMMKDYFIDVHVVLGDFGPSKYAQLSVDPIFGGFFDSNGLRTEQTQAFFNKQGVYRSFTGCIIPGFRDKNGQNQSIESIINAESTETGILCAIDKEQLDAYETGTNTKYLDLIGHSFLTNSIGATDFLSYKRKLTQDFTYTKKTSNTTQALDLSANATVTYSPGKIEVQVLAANTNFAALNTSLKVGSIFTGRTNAAGYVAGITVDKPVLYVTKVLKTASVITFEVTNDLKTQETATSGVFVSFDDGVPSTGAHKLEGLRVGDVIQLYKTVASVQTLIGNYTIGAGNSETNVIAGLVSAVNTGTGSHGVTAVNSSPTISLTAASGTNTFQFKLNGGTINITDTATTGSATIQLLTSIATSTFETTNDRFNVDSSNSFYIGDLGAQAYIDWKAGVITNGDKIQNATTTYYLKFEETVAQSGLDAVDDYRKLLKVSLYTDADLTLPATSGNVVAFGLSKDSTGYVVADVTKVNFISLIDKINERFPATLNDTKSARIPIAYESSVKVGQYLIGTDENDAPIMARITSIKRYGSPTVSHIDVTCDNNIKLFTSLSGSSQVERYMPIPSIYDHFDITYLPGFTLKAASIPDGTNARMKEIYAVMTDTHLSDTLVDPEIINFRYFIDTFNHGLEPQSKRYLTMFLKRRQKTFGIINAPTAAEFKKSTNPRFTSTPTASSPVPVLNVDYIRTGGNLEENPDFQYTLPDELDGASYAAWYFPNLEFIDANGNPKLVPPASYVGNNYAAKYRSNPFQAVAGASRGVLRGDGLADTERPLTKDERGMLEEKGINPIFKKANGQILIFGNQTGYQTFRSILNSAHARDTLITIEIDTEGIIEPFTFDFNDDTLKTQAEAALKKYLNGIRDGFNGISAYKFTFDRSNNPDWVASFGGAIIDLEVTIPDVARKFITRITLTRGSNAIVGAFTAI